MAKATYLGDGVYISFDGYQVWLHTGSHLNPAVVALEPEVFKSLCVEGTKIFQEASSTDFKADVILSLQSKVPDV